MATPNNRHFALIQDGDYLHLSSFGNQTRGLAQIVYGWFNPDGSGPKLEPDEATIERTMLFFTDAQIAGITALAAGENAPIAMRKRALSNPKPVGGVTMHGSTVKVSPRYAIEACCGADREWDTNGTSFAWNIFGQNGGEFGHNDFYRVPLAAVMQRGFGFNQALLGMIAIDEIRVALGAAFALKDYAIDHVYWGAVASAAVYSAMMGQTVDQIESAICLMLAHAVPVRAIRDGRDLSDSKGASAGISTGFAIDGCELAANGFGGPLDGFRNPLGTMRLFQGPGQKFLLADGSGTENTEASNTLASPVELYLCTRGGGFAINQMHAKMSLYEHQSAGAIQAILELITQGGDNFRGRLIQAASPMDVIQSMQIGVYRDASKIIGNDAKKRPGTRQSADHSMWYIAASVLMKAHEVLRQGERLPDWKDIILLPDDYGDDARIDQLRLAIIDATEVVYDPSLDGEYPDGIPTTIQVETKGGGSFSGKGLYPLGHAKSDWVEAADVLNEKWQRLLAATGVPGDPNEVIARFTSAQETFEMSLDGFDNYELLEGEAA